MTSLKSLLNCIGVDTGGQVNVLFHAFGFFRGRVPDDAGSTTRSRVSLLNYMNDLQREHIHINVISVGRDNYSNAEIQRIDYAIYRMRQIFRTVRIGVGRVEHYQITSGDANGRDDLGSQDEASTLTEEWTVDNNAIDVFVVDNISDTSFVGISPVDGTCDKDDKGWSGVIGGEVNRNDDSFARTFSHEIGHYLGLSHNHGASPACPGTTNGCNNLMAQTRCANNCGGGTRIALLLTNGQGNNMRNHCFVRSGC